MEIEPLEEFIVALFTILTSKSYNGNNLIRKHTCKLEGLGDLSFPLRLESWGKFINLTLHNKQTILEHQLDEDIVEKGLEKLFNLLNQNCIKIKQHKIIKNNVHLFFNRTTLITTALPHILSKKDPYEHIELISTKINLKTLENIENELSLSLSDLRLIKIKQVTENLLKCVTKFECNKCVTLCLSTQSVDAKNIVCGPVINGAGVKETIHTSDYLFKKRISEVKNMFEHKYGTQYQESSKLQDYFEQLGKACVTLELLTNQPQKSLKINLEENNESSKRGLLFVFYNCARISALFKEYNKKVEANLYPEMGDIATIDFSLLSEPEEWELFYVYILQYPSVIKSCIKEIESATINPQHLVTFLCNLSSVFSVYYRRVRILVDPRKHLISLIQARMCLLKALQTVFYHSLKIFNIAPIKEM